MGSNILYKIFQNTYKISAPYMTKQFLKNMYTTSILPPERTNQPGLKFKQNVQEEMLHRAMENSKVLTSKQWEVLKKNVIARGKIINEINFDAKVLSYCVAYKNFEMGKSLLEFYEAQNKSFNLGAVGKFMKLYYICNENQNAVDPKIEQIILNLYYSVKKQFPVLTTITAENVIPALCLTKEWRQCLDMMDQIKYSTRPSGITYSVVIKALFDHNEFDLAWNFLHEMSSDGKSPHPSVYLTWIKKVNENKMSTVKNLEKLLKYFAEYEILPTREVTDKIVQSLKSFSYNGTYVKIPNRGVCPCCKQELEEIVINEEDFHNLKTTFMNNVIVGKNIFTKTDPKELQRFMDFINDSGKFDMVIDGLNVAYSAGIKKNPGIYGSLLANVTRHYRKREKRILILGREHMKKWPSKFMDYIRQNATIFLTHNISQDDPFLLYATMASGLGTCFLSRDFMRGHSYLLFDSKLKKTFRQWQQVHQHSLLYVEFDGKVLVKPPYPYLCTTQNSKRGWHIPYVDNYVPMPSLSLDPPINWLCIH